MQEIEWKLGHHFHNPEFLLHALTHSSILHETGEERFQCNEKMELLGDSVLDLIVVDYLYHRFPKSQEGDLSKLKSAVVRGKSLGRIAKTIDLGNYILMSESEERNGGRERESILEDTFEAVVASIYLDGGQSAAKKFVSRTVFPVIDEVVDSKVDFNYKSQLLEYAQARSWKTPVYRVISERGPNHAKEFIVEVFLCGNSLGRGRGPNKKAAEQQAARIAIAELLS